MVTKREGARRRRRPGPVEQAVRSQLRDEEGELHGNGQARTARAAAALQLARAADAAPSPAKCPSCSHEFDVDQLPAARDLQGLLRELRMTLKRDDDADAAAAGALLEFLRGGGPAAGRSADADAGHTPPA